jgi:putative transposase
VVIATGVTAEGGREVLGVDVGDSEDEGSGPASSRAGDRGLGGVNLVISDAHRGLQAQVPRRCKGRPGSAVVSI